MTISRDLRHVLWNFYNLEVSYKIEIPICESLNESFSIILGLKTSNVEENFYILHGQFNTDLALKPRPFKPLIQDWLSRELRINLALKPNHFSH